MDTSTLIVYLIEVLCFIPAIVFHEVAHGYAAYKLGDPTAKSAGRLSLNPLKHIDPFGTVILPLCMMLMNGPIFGYAKPVPYNPTYFKDIRKGDFIVGIAGPSANLVMALLAAGIEWLLYLFAYDAIVSSVVVYYIFVLVLPYFALINLFLMFFNLLPIPPLDGSSIFALFIPAKHLPKYYKIQQYALPIFLILAIVVPYIINFNPFSWYLGVTAGNLANLLFPFTIYY